MIVPEELHDAVFRALKDHMGQTEDQATIRAMQADIRRKADEDRIVARVLREIARVLDVMGMTSRQTHEGGMVFDPYGTVNDWIEAFNALADAIERASPEEEWWTSAMGPRDEGGE